MPTPTINKLYTFSTIAPSILGARYSNVRLVAIMDYNLAVQQKNVELLHKQVAPYLLPGTPLDVKSYQFFKFQVTPTTFVVVSNHWVINNLAGFVESSSIDAIYRVFNIDGDVDLGIINEQLRLLGYTFTSETVTS